MKRLLSVVLSAVVLVASMLTVSAAVVEAESITVTTSAYTVTVKVDVPDAVEGTMTVQIINADNNALYAMDYSNTRLGASGDYYYQFELRMPASAQTASDYKVRVGNNVKKQETTFTYTNIEDKINFYNGLITQIATDPNGIDEYLNLPTTKVPVDIAAYNGLTSSDVLDFVNGEIAAIAGLVSVSGGASEQEKIDAVIANDSAFQPTFAEAMKLALIADASEADWEAVATAAIAEGTFDGKYYNAATAGNNLLDVTDVYSNYRTEGEAVTTISLPEYQKAFDKATLMLVTSSFDYTSIKEAFLYFENKGTLTVSDMTNIDALAAAGKDADLWKDLKVAGCADATALAAKAVEIAQTMVDNGALVQTPIGGGGGGAGGSSSTDRPTNPGSSMGITGEVPMIPAEPVNPTQPKPATGFADLANAEWSREAVEYLADKGVISGKDAGTFAPNDAVTREEGAKIIIGAFDLLKEANCEFTDVSADRWSYAYIAAAVELGIINGYGDSFGPTDTMTREQAATIIYRAAELIKLEVSGEKEDFTDADATSDWASDAIAHLAADGVINGMGDGTFAPKATLTRAQLAQLVYNVLVTIGGVN